MTSKVVIKKRFFDKVKKTDTCWIWFGAITGVGYGSMKIDGISEAAHRVSLMIVDRDIPVGMLVDHTCRVRVCVNPKHLRIVTARINSIENSMSIPAINIMKTHCINGHAFLGKNVLTRKRLSGGRKCRECDRTEARERYRRRSPYRSAYGYQ